MLYSLSAIKPHHPPLLRLCNTTHYTHTPLHKLPNITHITHPPLHKLRNTTHYTSCPTSHISHTHHYTSCVTQHIYILLYPTYTSLRNTTHIYPSLSSCVLLLSLSRPRTCHHKTWVGAAYLVTTMVKC